jgi:hypothetical protein
VGFAQGALGEKNKDPNAQWQKKADDLRETLRKTLRENNGQDAATSRALESFCTQWRNAKIFEVDPVLEVELKVCAGRGAQGQGRIDVAEKRFAEAQRLASPHHGEPNWRRVHAEAMYRLAEIAEAHYHAFPLCDSDLGLGRLRAFEGDMLQQLLVLVEGRFREVIAVGDRFWSRRASYRIGTLYDDFYRRRVLNRAGNFRGLALPSPFAVDQFHTRKFLRKLLAPKDARWPTEIRRLYDTLARDAEKGAPDAELLEELRNRANSFSALPPLLGEEVVNPWLGDLVPGVVSYRNRRFVVRQSDGSWKTVADPEGLALVRAGVAEKLGTAKNAYAMAAAAESGSAIPTARVLEALAHPEEKVRLAGLWAAQQAPDKAYEESLLQRWRTLSSVTPTGSIDPKEKRPPLFGTLKDSLFGERERLLLALAALVREKRDVAKRVTREKSLPPFERAWLVADLGDTHLLPSYQAFFSDRDPQVAALGIYGAYLTSGSKALWMAREKSRDSRELVRCVAQHVVDMESLRGGQNQLPDGRTGSLP